MPKTKKVVIYIVGRLEVEAADADENGGWDDALTTVNTALAKVVGPDSRWEVGATLADARDEYESVWGDE